MTKTYKIIQHFGDDTTKETSQQTKPSLKDVFHLLYHSYDPQINPSSICVQVFVYDFPKLNNALGLEVKFVPDNDVLVEIFNISPPKRKSGIRQISKFFLVTFENYRRIIGKKQKV